MNNLLYEWNEKKDQSLMQVQLCLINFSNKLSWHIFVKRLKEKREKNSESSFYV